MLALYAVSYTHLDVYKRQGYKMAVATSSRSGYAIHNLKEAGIYGYFDGAVFGDMVLRAKPDAEIYLKACESIKARPKYSIALEDAPAGIRSAHAAGMMPVMIPDLVEPDEDVYKRQPEYDPCYSMDRLYHRTFGMQHIPSGSVCDHRDVKQMHHAVRRIFHRHGTGSQISDDAGWRLERLV